MGHYTARQIQRLTGASAHQLQYWEKTNLVVPSVQPARGRGTPRIYSFSDLAFLQMIMTLRGSGQASLQSVRSAVLELCTHLGEDLRDAVLKMNGRDILLRMPGPLAASLIERPRQLVWILSERAPKASKSGARSQPIKEFNQMPNALIQARQRDWTFLSANTKEGTHIIHTYPAMMIPQLAGGLISLLQELNPQGKTLLDPFAGAGTVLVEGLRAGLNCWGNDLNPLAELIARARTARIEEGMLTTIEGLIPQMAADSVRRASDPHLTGPDFAGRDFWFQPEAVKHLSALRQVLVEYVEAFPEAADLLWATFSETVRLCSNTRRGEFKLYRMAQSKLSQWEPLIEETYARLALRYIHGLREYQEFFQHHDLTFLHEDTRKLIGIAPGTIDFVVTSPPYGDSHTTVAYGQFSRLSLEWLGWRPEVARGVDRRLLGGQGREIPEAAPGALQDALGSIRAMDPKRANEVAIFYADLQDALSAVTRTLHPGSLSAWVVANRTVKGITIPTEEILADMAEAQHYTLLGDLPRDIPHKRMPLENSPSNVAGIRGQTMKNEHIVLLRYEGAP